VKWLQKLSGHTGLLQCLPHLADLPGLTAPKRPKRLAQSSAQGMLTYEPRSLPSVMVPLHLRDWLEHCLLLGSSLHFCQDRKSSRKFRSGFDSR
jgi:hypothetical protein